MAEDQPCKQDIASVFKRLRAIPTNKICFDCGTKNPTWSSVTYGVFICMDCSAVHRSLGVHLSFVRSTQLDSWTWLQLRAMQSGGNSNATAFFRQHNCTTTDAQQKYKSRAASLYREKLHHMAAAAMRTYGNDLNMGHNDHHVPTTPENKEVDFFEEQSEAAFFSNNDTESTEGVPIIKNGALPINNNNGEGPNVEAALSTSPSQAQKTQEVRKSTIGIRKPAQNKKSGLGARKGLGAQRVKTNFNEIEKEAQLADQRKEEFETNRKIQQKLSQEEEEKQMASVRLAYKDLSVQRQKQEERMLKADPRKAEQFERLGMGFGGRSGVSHSVASEMKTIDQETPLNAKASQSRESRYQRRNSFEDEFEFLGMTAGPPKYNDSPFSKLKQDSYSSSSYKSESSRNTYSDEVDGNRRSSKVSSIPSSNNDDCAQKKFGNAKAISSDQYFGGSREGDYERQTNLAKFQGSSSISSADYFGEPQRANNKNYNYNGPNLAEIKDGVKDGVNKVAGRLSNIASGVMSSFQDRYGH